MAWHRVASDYFPQEFDQPYSSENFFALKGWACWRRRVHVCKPVGGHCDAGLTFRAKDTLASANTLHLQHGSSGREVK